MGKQNELFKHWLGLLAAMAKKYEETTIDGLLEKDSSYEGDVKFSGCVNEARNFESKDPLLYFTLKSEKTGKTVVARGFCSDSDYLKYHGPLSVGGDKVTIAGRYFRWLNGLRIDEFYNHDHVERTESD